MCFLHLQDLDAKIGTKAADLSTVRVLNNPQLENTGLLLYQQSGAAATPFITPTAAPQVEQHLDLADTVPASLKVLGVNFTMFAGHPVLLPKHFPYIFYTTYNFYTFLLEFLDDPKYLAFRILHRWKATHDELHQRMEKLDLASNPGAVLKLHFISVLKKLMYQDLHGTDRMNL